jgi:predicted amidohydrolase
MVSPSGSVIANYRKHHLYMTDETWAEEGKEGFFASDVPTLGRVAIGICMFPPSCVRTRPVLSGLQISVRLLPACYRIVTSIYHS